MNRTVRPIVAGLLATGGLALAACVVPEVTIEVTTTADTVADDGVTSLREAFAITNRNNANNTIVLAEGATYELTDCAGGGLVHTSTRALTIDGNGSTIVQTCTNHRILATTQVTSRLAVGETTLSGVPRSGGDLRGAAIDAVGSLSLGDSTITGVDAGPGGTVVDGNTGGPAANDIRLDFSAITGNVGTGVEISNGRVRLDVGSVTSNTGDGVRLLGDSSVDLFQSVSVSGNGGWGIRALGHGDSEVSITFSGVFGNAAGGVYCSGCRRILIEHAGVEGNGAAAQPGSGGGVVFLVDQDDPDDAPRLTINTSSVNNNRARRAGGGLFVGIAESSAPEAPPASTGFFATTMEGNATLGDNQPGGAIAVTTGSLGMFGLTARSNVAGGTGSDGGAIYFEESPADRILAPAHLDLQESLYEDNHASGRGGAVFASSSGPITLNSDLVRNTAGGDGGGAYLSTTATAQLQSEFMGNSSGARGGGAFVRGEGSTVSALFQLNRATEGGGLYLGATDRIVPFDVQKTTFDANTAMVRGGGLAAADTSRLVVENSTVNANWAPAGGGISMGTGPGSDPEGVSLRFVTMADNAAPTGAHVSTSGPLLTFASTVVLALGGGTSCATEPGRLIPQGRSFVADATCGRHPTDTVSTADPQLAPLARYPGPPGLPGSIGPFVRIPAPTSPTGGLVPVDLCEDISGDQGFGQRPQGTACEPGAVEIVED